MKIIVAGHVVTESQRKNICVYCIITEMKCQKLVVDYVIAKIILYSSLEAMNSED